MNTNLETIKAVIDYIEEHVEETLSLDDIAYVMGYSKYHLSRMFANIVGFSLHSYIQRRRLTEAAKKLIDTEQSIIDIALLAGYDSQQSFTMAFKKMFKCSPRSFRKKKNFYPIQLKFAVDGKVKLRGDQIMDIKVVDSEKIILVGFKKSTRFGFEAIGWCWREIHARKQEIIHRTDSGFLIGLNDYKNWSEDEKKQPAFDYFAAAEVKECGEIPKGMEVKELPASRYVVFSYRGKSQDSIQPVVDYIYKEWFPSATAKLNEKAQYDFVKYGEAVDEEGKSLIEYWVPII